MNPVKLGVLGFSLLAFGAAANAQSTAKDRQQSKEERMQQQSQPQQQPQKQQSQQQQSQQQQSQQQSAQISLERLGNAQLVDRQGRGLGNIDDVVVDLQRGRVHAVVAGVGGILGVGDKQYAFPMSKVQRQKDGRGFMVDADKEKLEDAQGFAKGAYPGMDDEFWARVGGEQAAAGGTAQKPGPYKLIRSSDMIGKEIHGRGGEKLGEIRDVLVDAKDGALQQLVVDLEDGRMANVPAKGLSAGTDERLVLDMSAEQVRAKARSSREAPKR